MARPVLQKQGRPTLCTGRSSGRFHMHRSIGATWRGVCDRVFLVVCFRLCLHIANTTLSTLYSGSVAANVKTVCSGGVVINVKKVYSATLLNGATQKAAPHKACE